ncbi:MAG: hypothetical protein DWQ19_09580 [Crenarchaeota archaeon]|nr:MAG: hypothetical protein DWQ19_09580 [Thermoproteota archaeon]
MCNSATLSLIRQEVEQKVQLGVLFTAFDVTLAVQETLKGQGQYDPSCHRHRYLKNDVHRVVSEIAGSSYDRKLQDVGAPSEAYVYFPIGADPASYVPLQRKDSPVDNAVGPYSIDIPVPAIIATNNGDGHTVDARGSLTIPAALMRQLGFNFDETAYVAKEGNSLTVSRTQPKNDQVATYTVDHNCNVRLTRPCLAQVFENVDSYDFEVGNVQGVDCILVKNYDG